MRSCGGDRLRRAVRAVARNGFSTDLLEELHENLMQARQYVPDYCAELAAIDRARRTTMDTAESTAARVAVVGASGFIGGALHAALVGRRMPCRALAGRQPEPIDDAVVAAMASVAVVFYAAGTLTLQQASDQVRPVVLRLSNVYSAEQRATGG